MRESSFVGPVSPALRCSTSGRLGPASPGPQPDPSCEPEEPWRRELVAIGSQGVRSEPAWKYGLGDVRLRAWA